MGYSTHELLLFFIYGIAGLLGGLTLLIVGNKAWREGRETLNRRRRSVLEPGIFKYIGGKGSDRFREHMPGQRARRDLRLTEEILLDASRLVKGGASARITEAFESLGSVSSAIHALRSRRWWKRAEAAEHLGLMRSKEAVEPLAAAMNDPISEVRIRSARALGLIRGSTSIRPLVGALADPSRWSAIRVAEILISVGAEAVDELLRAYDELPHHAKISTLDILGRIRSHRGADRMRASLRDPHPDIRARAAHAMGLIGDPGFSDDLVAALGDPEWAVRAMAAKSLGRLGGAKAVPRLCEAITDRQWWVRANAGEALRSLGPAGREALIKMLDADDTYARHQAVAQLEEGRIIDEYIGDLASPDPEKRAAAIRFVEKIISLKRVDHLSHEAIEHTQEGVRRTLLDILGRSPQGAS